MSLIEFRDVAKTYGAQQVLHDISFAIQPAQILTIIGPNGAGKSTLVRLILGLEEPTTGTIYRQADISFGYMPQSFQPPETMPLSAWRFVTLGSRAGKNEVKAAFARAGATHLDNRPVESLSGGEMQRVLLTRALLRRPKILVFDEPAQGIDVVGQSEFYDSVSKIRDELACSIVMVSHDLHLVMAASDHVLCLNGHICCAGHPEAVGNHPEYRHLFGEREERWIGVYTHHHDHHHSTDNDPI